MLFDILDLAASEVPRYEKPEFNVNIVNEIIHRDAIAVELELHLDDMLFLATGVARRHPDDEYNREIGVKLAYARALASFARQLDRQAQGAVKHADDIRGFANATHTNVAPISATLRGF
jgi:hypothetical protein